MIWREEKLVITFSVTVHAVEMERCCKMEGAPGRLIPVPGFISAGCGLAWCAPPEAKRELLALMERQQILPERVLICLV